MTVAGLPCEPCQLHAGDIGDEKSKKKANTGALFPSTDLGKTGQRPLAFRPSHIA